MEITDYTMAEKFGLDYDQQPNTRIEILKTVLHAYNEREAIHQKRLKAKHGSKRS